MASTTPPSITLAGLINALRTDGRVFALAGADPQLLENLKKYGTLTDFDNSHITRPSKEQSPRTRVVNYAATPSARLKSAATCVPAPPGEPSSGSDP